MSRRLTLNLGLRWDPFIPFTDPDNRFAQVRFGQQSKLFPTAPLGYVFPGDPGVPEATYPSSGVIGARASALRSTRPDKGERAFEADTACSTRRYGSKPIIRSRITSHSR